MVFEWTKQGSLRVDWTETSGLSKCHLQCSFCSFDKVFSFETSLQKLLFLFLNHKVQVTTAFKSICGWAARCQHRDTGTQSIRELVGESSIELPEYAMGSIAWHLFNANENCRTKLQWEYKRRFWKMIWFVNDAGWSPIVTLAQIRALTDQRNGNVKCAKWSQEVAGRWLGPGESSLLLSGSNFRVSLHPSPRTPLWPRLTSLICLR